MTDNDDLEKLIQQNPKAAPHVGSIREALEILKKARGSVGQRPSSPKLPLGKATIEDAPKPRNRSLFRSFKLRFFA